MILSADSECPDQTARPRSLIWAFAVSMLGRHFFAFRGPCYSAYRQLVILFAIEMDPKHKVYVIFQLSAVFIANKFSQDLIHVQPIKFYQN